MTSTRFIDFNPTSAISANEENLQTLCFTLARLSHKEICEQKDYAWIFTTPSVWPNFVFNFNLKSPQVLYNSRFIRRRMAADFQPKWLVMNDQQDDGQWLTQNGFQLHRQWAGMAANLSTLPQNIPPVEGLKIISVTDNRTFQQWMAVINTALFETQALEVRMMHKLLQSPDTTMFLAILNGIPVASSMLYLSAGVAGIYMVATLTNHRGQGIGRLITLEPLLLAQQLGYNMAVLQATPMGYPVYQTVGFERLFWYNVYGIRR